MDKNGTYSTPDLYLASALKLKGIPLVELRADGQRGIFVFKDFEGRPEFVRRYFDGSLEGSLKGFANAWSDLKALVHSSL